MAKKNKKEKVMMTMMNEFPLPDEVVLSSILPLLSMKDLARSSLVSRTWRRYWRNTPILSFDDPCLTTMIFEAAKDASTYFNVLSDARTSFTAWVNNVLYNHMGCRVEEFRVAYYLTNTHRVYIDRWVVWALSKHVQRLVLDLTPPCIAPGVSRQEKYYYVLDRALFGHSCKLYLTTLFLKSVNVDDLAVNYLLDACRSTLESLCIINSQSLTSITDVELLSLKYIMVDNCPKLETIDIKAPKLVSLTYHSAWDPSLRLFNIGNASKLCDANIVVRVEEGLLFVMRSLFKYFSQLEHLKLQCHDNRPRSLVLDKFPVLANLKHLELSSSASCDRTLAAWVPFIGACPRLEKFTLEIFGMLTAVAPKNVYREKCQLRCLKTFEIKRFHGTNLDVDIANFVVENAFNLREVILHPCDLLRPLNLKAPFARVDFELPPHVKLVIVR